MWLMAPKEVCEERQRICDICPNKKNNICTLCKCYIPMKVSFSKASCPCGKWDAVETGNLIDK